MTRILLLVILLGLLGCSADDGKADLLIRNAVIVDGSGEVPIDGDLVVDAGRIVHIGDAAEHQANEVIDAAGRTLAPGFIDLHSHADLILLAPVEKQQELLEAKIRQGVTTVIVGNCGLGVAPSSKPAAEILAQVNSWMTPDGIAPGPVDIGNYLRRLERGGIVLNAGTLMPHGPVRISAMGLAAGAPDERQLESMRKAIRNGLRAGAFGVSSGLIYPPGMFSNTDELVALAGEVATRDRLWTAHIRGSSETLLDATKELIDIARQSGARVHHSHLEAVGERFWPLIADVLALEDEARAEGLRISHDVFPYTRAATMMAAIFPPWALEGGVPALIERLADPSTRRRIRDEIARREPEWPPWQPGGWPHNLVGAVGWDGIRVNRVTSNERQPMVGASLEQLAGQLRRSPFEIVADLMIDEHGEVGQLVDEISGRDGQPPQIDGLLAILQHPSAAIVTDAEDYGQGRPHPAHAGAFARALRLNRELDLMPLEEMIHRMTTYPAELLGLERGRLEVGAPADLVLFDPDSVADQATWDEPRRHATGIDGVWINGEPVLRDGQFVPATAGQVLRAR